VCVYKNQARARQTKATTPRRPAGICTAGRAPDLLVPEGLRAAVPVPVPVAVPVVATRVVPVACAVPVSVPVVAPLAVMLNIDDCARMALLASDMRFTTKLGPVGHPPLGGLT
jgi:hypothetical protein